MSAADTVTALRQVAPRGDEALWQKLGVTSLALAGSGATTLVFNLVLARTLGPETFGDVARTFALGIAVAQLTMASVAPTVARVVAAGKEDERLGLAAGAVRILAVTGLLVSALYPLLALLGFAPVDPLSIALGWGLAFVYSFYYGLKRLFFSLDRAVTYAALEGASDLVFFVLLGLLAWLAGEAGIAAFLVAYSLFSLAGMAVLRRRRPKVRPIALDPGFGRYAGLSFLATYASVGRFPVAIVIAGVVGSSVISAELAVVFSLMMPLFLLPQAASMITFASAARGDRVRAAVVRRTVELVSMLVCLSVLGYVVLADPVLRVLAGSEYAGLAPELTVLAICLAPQLIAMPVANASAAEGAIGINAAIAFAGLAVAAIGAAVAVPAHGTMGAAVAVAASGVLMGVLVLAHGWRLYNLRLADLGGSVALLAMAGVAATADVRAGSALLAAATGAVAFYSLRLVRRSQVA